jgi:hypothetical protein
MGKGKEGGARVQKGYRNLLLHFQSLDHHQGIRVALKIAIKK